MSKYSETKKSVQENLNSIYDRIKKAISNQRALMLGQMAEFNASLSRYGLVLCFDGDSYKIYDYTSDFKGGKKNDICITFDEKDKISESVLDYSSVFKMGLDTMSLNQVLKPSIAVGGELISCSMRETIANLPKNMKKDLVMPILKTSAFRFLAGGDRINDLYLLGDPSPKTFRLLDNTAYTMSHDILDSIAGKSM